MKKKELLDDLIQKLDKMDELMVVSGATRPYIADDAIDLPIASIRDANKFINRIHDGAWADLKRLWHAHGDVKYWSRLEHLGLSNSHEAIQLSKKKKALKVAFHNAPAFFHIEKVNKILAKDKS